MNWVLQEGEIYRRTSFSVDEEPPSISIVNRDTIVAVSPTVYYSRPIPARGVTMEYMMRMGYLLHVSSIWILGQLNRPEYGAAAGRGVARVAERENAINLSPRSRSGVVPPLVIHQRVPQFPVLRVLPPVETDNAPDDDDCVICVGTVCSTTWATCAGCDFHRFHLECISRWKGSDRCMVCRRQLLRE